MIRVLLADDQALVRSGFRMIVEAHPDIEVIGEAEDGREALEIARERPPDVVLMDIRMPRMDGIEATRELARAGAASRVLILTTFDLDEYVYEGLRAGASGFLLKNAPPEELVDAIRAVAGGESLLAPEITQRLIEHYVSVPAPADEPRLADLSAREREVLELVARGLSNAEIAQMLFLSHGTVKTHITRILSKLDLRDRVQAVVLAYESGLVRAGEGRSRT